MSKLDPGLQPLGTTCPIEVPCLICSPFKKLSVVSTRRTILQECFLTIEGSFHIPEPLNSISTFLVIPMESPKA